MGAAHAAGRGSVVSLGSFGGTRRDVLPSLLQIPANLRVGAQRPASHETLAWEGTEEELKGAASIHHEVVGRETITTPAGKFEDCVTIRFEGKFREEDQEFLSTGLQWHEPGLGLVRIETEHEGACSLVELIAIDPECPPSNPSQPCPSPSSPRRQRAPLPRTRGLPMETSSPRDAF